MKNMNLFDKVLVAKEQLKGVVNPTPLMKNINLSDEFKANVFLKEKICKS